MLATKVRKREKEIHLEEGIERERGDRDRKYITNANKQKRVNAYLTSRATNLFSFSFKKAVSLLPLSEIV